MNTSKIAWFVSAGLAVSSYAAVAQEFKVGYINTQTITTQSTPAKAAQAKAKTRTKAVA